MSPEPRLEPLRRSAMRWRPSVVWTVTRAPMASRLVWRPPESDRAGVLVYAAKAHPELEGEGLVVTYAGNATDFGRLVADETLYYPRFVRVEG